MGRINREEIAIRLIHRKLTPLLIVSVIIGALVFYGLYRGGLIGPIVNDNTANTTFEWRVSDHDSSGKILQNSTTADDSPQYPGNTVIELNRKTDGSLEALPRLQGQLEYHHN